jgi:hypothetical protein
MSAATFDAGHAVAFLDQIFGDVTSGRLSVCYLKPDGRMAYQHHQWIRYVVAQAQEWDKLHPQGIYFRVTMLPPRELKGKRGSSDDSHAVAFWWADIDYGTEGHKPPPGTALPPNEDAAREIIALLPTPSLLIHSGGGLYPIWKFAEPVYLTAADRDQVKTRSQHWQDMIHAKAERLGFHYGSGVGDLARVLRLPGSINRKTGNLRPCRVAERTGEVYEW